MNPVYMIGGLRTPIGKTDGFLKDLLPEQLASIILNEVIHKYSLSPNDIDQVILGNAVGPGGNIARVSVLAAGWPYSIPAITVDTQCGSGLSAINLAVSQIQSGQTELVLAGGVESTSLAPRRQFNPADPRFQGEQVYYERAPFSTPAVGDPEVGDAAEYLAEYLSISREDMDALALESHRRASMTKEQDVFKDIITPIQTAGKVIHSDECIRSRMSLKLLERMQPVFKAEGKITAGNTCLKHDGAALILLASSNAVKKYNLKPIAKIVSMAVAGVDPAIMGIGPVPATQKVLLRAGLKITDIDLFELNEAFASQSIACMQELNIEPKKVNVNGGAIALGHPLGCSGVRISATLLHEMQKRKSRFGLATMCVGVGQGAAIIYENIV